MLSNTSKYAIRSVIYLALYSSGEKKVGIREISEALNIPTPFLGKILQNLAKHQILESTKGPHGGFCLKRQAIDIPLMEIIEIIDGGDLFDRCVIRTTKCNYDAPCSLHDKIFYQNSGTTMKGSGSDPSYNQKSHISRNQSHCIGQQIEPFGRPCGHHGRL
jgi:Rrf2 family iron-sulfur cluster assembly transcriptional regulator